MQIFRIFSVSCWIGIVLIAGQVRGADAPFWPRFHGPNGDNLSTDTGLLKEWPEEGPERLWTTTGIGEGFSGVALSGGKIFTAGNVDDKTVVTAMDLDGKILWQADCGKAWAEDHAGSRSTPTIDGNLVFFENPYGVIYCLNANNGKEIWNVPILEKFGSKNLHWGLAESLLVDGNHVLCLPGGPQASVVALNKKTGDTVWIAESADGDLAGYATASLIECEGLRIVLTMTSKALIGVDADRGHLLFRFPHKTNYDVNATTPIYHNGQIFITSGYGTTGSVMLQLHVDGTAASVEKLWGSRELDNHHGGVILLDGFVYGAAHQFNNSKWICLDWETGKVQYAERGVGKGSLTYADGMLYTWSEQRNVGLVQATPDGHPVVSRFRTPSGPEGPTWAHPVVCGGRLYLRHGDCLYAYHVMSKQAK